MSFGWGGKSKSERARSGQFASKSQVAKQRSAFLAPVQRWEKVWVTPDTTSSGNPGTGNATASSANGYRVKKWVPVSSLSNDQTAEDQQEAALNAAQSSDLNDLAGLQLPGQQQPHQNSHLQPATADASARASQSQTPVPQPPSTKQPTPAPAEPTPVPAEAREPTPVKTEEPQPQPQSEQQTEPQSVQEAKEQQESQPQEDTEMGVTAPVEAAPEAPAPVETETQAEARSVQPEGKADEPETSEQLDDVAEAERRKAVTNPLDEGALAESQADLHQPPPA